MGTVRTEFLRTRLTGRSAVLPTISRMVAGAIFVTLSVGKFVRHDAEVEKFITYGFSNPSVLVYLVGVLELVAGLGLVVGFGVRLAALGLAVDMIGAIATAGRVEGGPIHLGLAPALLAVMIFLLWAGAGAASLDSRLARRRSQPSST